MSKTNTIYFRIVKCVNNNCCDALENLRDFVCINATNSTPTYLRSHSNGTLENIYELEITDNKYLPAGAFNGHIVDSIHFMGPDLIVDTNILKGINSLKTFDVAQSGIQNIPNFTWVKDSVKLLSIVSSRLTSLEGQNLQNLSLVEFLSFRNNSISYIHPDVLKGTDYVSIFDLSYNMLTFIPPNLLDDMKRLSFFRVSYNYLLHVNNVFSVTRPRYTLLMVNNMTDISSALQFNIEKVQKMTTGTIINCREENADVTRFQALYNIETLDLSYNSIKEPSQFVFPCYSTEFYSYILRIRNLRLDGNNLKNLGFLLRFSQILKLEIPYNQLQFLSDDDFKLTSGIAYLDLRKNEIKRIDTNTLQPIKTYLYFLDLSSNFIKSLNGSVRYLAELRHLDLKNNSLKSFASDEFVGLNELLELYLQNNQIKTIQQLQHLPRLRYLNIKQNEIDLIKPDEIPNTLEYMHLDGNRPKCDCNLQLFIQRLDGNSIATDVDTCIQSELDKALLKKSICPEMCSCTCVQYANPPFISVDCSLKNLTIVPKFPEKMEITFDYWRPLLKDERIYTLYSIGDSTLKLVMNNGTIPSYESTKVPPKISHQKIHSNVHIEDNVCAINLENNSLESLDGVDFPPNLIQLYLSNNKLRSLPDVIFENQRDLKEVTLSGNPWKCDCSALKFKNWLTTEKDIIKDIDNVRCELSDNGLSNRVIWTLTDLELCPTDVALIVSASSTALGFIIFCLVAKLLYTKYKLSVKVFLYSHGFEFVKEEDLDYEKIFDAFVSFSHKDDEFVIKEIITEIERRDPSILLCIHYRHFTPGELIYKNITQAVKNSKRTLFILSKYFLEAEWCLFEFKTAHTQFLEDKMHRIIVIKVGDLPEDMDPLIKSVLDSTTYLSWGEKNFWNKLLYVLPNRKNIRNPVPRSEEDYKNASNCPETEL